MMLVSELDYELPAGCIATQAAEPRDSARLMVIRRADGRVEHRVVSELGEMAGVLGAGDLMVFNRSRVLPAWFGGKRKGTGGKVEGLYLSSVDVGGEAARWRVMMECGGRLRVGERVELGEGAELELVEGLGEGQWECVLRSGAGTRELLEKIGRAPVPGYIRKERKGRGEAEVNEGELERYNTVYAQDAGSVAAPTAGLHFTEGLIGRLKDRGVEMAYVTLHVGLGTFAPVRARRLEEHKMHEEWFEVSGAAAAAMKRARERGGRIIAVGTTSVRAMESLPADVPACGCEGSTRLFVWPGAVEAGSCGGEGGVFRGFRWTDGLLTNFHLPGSTLLALVAALPGVGVERLKGWYGEAIEKGYRFYSYGDAMLIV